MIHGDAFRRKLRKFRASPSAFFADTKIPALKFVGRGLAKAAPVLKSVKLKVSLAAGAERKIVEESELFDRDFYVAVYPELRRHRDPLGHYLEHGAREHRWPNAMFDPLWYAAEVELGPSENPLLHYIRRGERKGSCPHPQFDPAFYRTQYPDVERSGQGPLAHFLAHGMERGRVGAAPRVAALGEPSFETDLRSIAVTVLVRVSRGGETLRRCLDALLTYTHMPDVQVLLIDDAAGDAANRSPLGSYEGRPGVTVLENPHERGFHEVARREIERTAPRDVVLLEDATVVGPRWLENLALAAHGTPRVATATALSDGRGPFSTPGTEENHTSGSLAVHEAARISQRAPWAEVQEVDAGDGFCMYVRREAIDAAGRWERGWYARATERGYRHVVALRAYAQRQLAPVGAADEEPSPRPRAERAIDAGPLAFQRRVMRNELKRKGGRLWSTRPRLLVALSSPDGRRCVASDTLMEGLSHVFEPLLLECSSSHLRLVDYAAPLPRELEHHPLGEPSSGLPSGSEERDAVISSWLVKHGVELVHVQQIVGLGDGLVRAANRLRIPVVCVVDGLGDASSSSDPIGDLVPTANGGGPSQPSSKTLEGCDTYVATSRMAMERWSKSDRRPAHRGDDDHLIPRGRNFDVFLTPPPAPDPARPLRVLLAGNLEPSRGLDAVLELTRLDRHSRVLEIHAVGAFPEELTEAANVWHHGPYRAQALRPLVARVRPHVGLVPSWPDGACDRLADLWAIGLPVVGFGPGPVGEQITEAGAGRTIDQLDAQQLYRLLASIRSGGEDWSPLLDAVIRWQHTIGTEWTVARMSAEYLDVYRSARARYRSLVPAGGRRDLAGHRKRVALVVRGNYPAATATAHVRIASQVHQSSGDVDYDYISGAELLATDVRDFDGVVVCRNAALPRVLSDLARRCRLDNVPVVLDLDDDLLNVPPDKDPRNAYRDASPSIRELLESAALTTVSTERLRTLCEPLTRRVQVVPNRLDPRIWLGRRDALGAPAGLDTGAKIRVLYMGTATHAEDLDLIAPVFERLRAELGVVLHLVGITKRPPPNVRAIDPPSARYDHFARWLLSVAPHFDIAVAPLVDTPFNRHKSAIKFMEYATCELPVVASRVEPYERVIREGVDGFLASTEEEWFEIIARLVENPDLRAEIAAAAKARAEVEFVARSCVFDELPWEEWRRTGASAHPAGRAPAAPGGVEGNRTTRR